MSAKGVSVKRSTVSKGTNQRVDAVMLLGVVFLVMALLQVISFGSFKDWFAAVGFSSPATWAVVILLLEVIAGVGFLKIALPPMAKKVSRICAILASGFWFIENIRLVSDTTTQYTSSGFFGKYLSQTPGWWTVIEVTILLVWTIYALDATKD